MEQSSSLRLARIYMAVMTVVLVIATFMFASSLWNQGWALVTGPLAIFSLAFFVLTTPDS